MNIPSLAHLYDTFIFTCNKNCKLDWSFSRVKGRRTPNKNLDKGVSKRNHWGSRDKEDSDVSNVEPALTSKVDEMNSGKVSLKFAT